MGKVYYEDEYGQEIFFDSMSDFLDYIREIDYDYYKFVLE